MILQRFKMLFHLISTKTHLLTTDIICVIIHSSTKIWRHYYCPHLWSHFKVEDAQTCEFAMSTMLSFSLITAIDRLRRVPLSVLPLLPSHCLKSRHMSPIITHKSRQYNTSIYRSLRYPRDSCIKSTELAREGIISATKYSGIFSRRRHRAN